MSNAPNAPNPPPPAGAGLPPVQPPSGQMILRLFLVPASIVGVLVLLFLVGPKLQGWFNRVLGRPPADARSADEFLRDLDNTNPEVRWRAATDLAQVLLRNDALAANADFNLQLAERLAAALDRSAAPEKEYAGRVAGLGAGEKARETARLEPDRKLIIYLTASLGNCMLPVGAPLLGRMAVQTSGMEANALAERRRRALFALATLGENQTRFDRLAEPDKDAALDRLTQACDQGRHAGWARPVLEHLARRRQGKADTLGVARVLKTCAAESDPFLRELSALASNFWQGDAAEEAEIENFLVQLSNDAGEGEDALAEQANDGGSRPVTTVKGYKVQANATVALARRGSPRVRLDRLAEMLDPDRLGEIFVLRTKAGDRPDESLVTLTLTDALKALARLRAKRPGMNLERFPPLVEALTRSTNPAVRTEALQAQLPPNR
jgi:hypothetical protein